MNIKTLIGFSIVLLGIQACGTSKESEVNKAPYEYEYVHNGQLNESGVKGTIVDESGDPIIGAKVMIYQVDNSFIAGAATDIDGKFHIHTTFEGSASIHIEYIGMYSNNLPERFMLNLIVGKTIIFNDTLRMREPQIELLKPMIYIYPEDTLAVSVAVKTPGKLMNCYPEYEQGWNITAYPNGNLVDIKGRNYYGLYWESNLANIFSINSGNVVSKEDNITFMEESLAKLGLSEREANEFIVFWLPVLNQSDFNLIHFSTEVYDEKIPLTVSPKPDQLIRIMMFYKPLNAPMNFPKQELSVTQRLDQGFIVVEWGGSKINEELENRASRLRSMSGTNSTNGKE